MNIEPIYHKMLLIRETELKIEELFSLGVLRGTTHGCIGQEAIPVALSELLDIDYDYICSGHRAHGYAVALSMKPELLIGEIMGKPCGFAKGMGGSQHIYYKNFFTNGITGGMVPVTSGLAFALKQNSKNAIAVVSLGDGAMNEGYVMETFNLATVLKLPILFVLENNSYAMSTAVEYASPHGFEKRVKGFGLEYKNITSDKYNKVYNGLKEAVNTVRDTRMPYFVEVVTHRFCGHSKSDKRAYIPKEKDDFWNENDCLFDLEKQLTKDSVTKIQKDVKKIIEKAVEVCYASI